MNCVKRAETTKEFSLSADTGESFLIKLIIFADALTTGYPVFRVDRKTVGCYRGGTHGVSHLGYLLDAYLGYNLMDYLSNKGINLTIPIAEGQRFTVDRAGNTGAVVAVYDIYDAGDITANMLNGSGSNEYNFLQYITASAALDSVGDHLLDVSLSPAEFPDFPCGQVVPARHTIEILGLVGQPVCQGGVDPAFSATQYVKLIKDREVLFDEDRAGLPFMAITNVTSAKEYKTEFSLIGDCVNVATGLSDPSVGLPLLFDTPLRFVSGEELLVYLTVSLGTGGTLAAADVRLAAIMNVKVE